MVKKILQFILFFSLLAVIGFSNVSAKVSNPIKLLAPDVAEDMRQQSDYAGTVAFNPATDKTSMTQIIAVVIQVFLSLLGVIFVMIIVIAGYNWMTAGGNEEKVDKARKLISRATIGLIIIVSAYAITYWIFARLPSGVNVL